MDKSFLKALLTAPSPSGYEGSASNEFYDQMHRVATIVKRDNAGNTVFVMGNPEAKAKIMLSAHIDEISLQIQNIDDKGFLHFVKNGGIDQKVLPGSQVKIFSARGVVDGVIGKTPMHLEKGEERGKVLELKDLKIDIGAETREEAASRVSIGDVAVVHCDPIDLTPNRIAGRGLDDKAGIFVIAEVAAMLAKEDLSNICVYFVACTQEETTATGAVVAAAGIDPTYYEAATVDGASTLQKIRYIDIPMILPTAMVLLILRAGSILGIGFEKVFLLQNVQNIMSSEIISTYVYKMGMQSMQYSLSTAIGLFNTVVNLIVLLLVNFLAKRATDSSLF